MTSADPRLGPRHDESGQATLMIVGLFFVLTMTIAMVVDVSAAFLQRQGLDTVADGAALRAADLGATGEEVYGAGVPRGRLELSVDEVRGSVDDYLASSGAYAAYPGLSFELAINEADSTVTVRITAPLDLPLTVPGSPGVAQIGAEGSAVVVAEQ